MPEEYAVELRDVVKRFGSVTAVNHVSIQISDGEFFSLLGPSGCGKTTTLRLIAGFEIPTSGEVYISGVLQGYQPAYKRPVNTVFQHYALFPHMNVEENVNFGLEMQGVPKAEIRRRVGEALELVHLTGMGKRRPKQLSGGQQQRVALARALVNHPKVLLLDEPLGALDLKLRKAMQVELKALQSQVGITFVYVTHDQEEALTMSDRIAVMNEGDLLQIGSAQEVYEAPQTRFVSDFIGETNYIGGQLVRFEDSCGEVAVAPNMRVWAYAGSGVQTGQQVSVAFRPEKVTLSDKNIEGQNNIWGVICNIVYIGSSTTYHVKLLDGTVIMARLQNTDATSGAQYKTGDEITVSWPIESTKAFAD